MQDRSNLTITDMQDAREVFKKAGLNNLAKRVTDDIAIFNEMALIGELQKAA
jgi:hypothetical protein